MVDAAGSQSSLDDAVARVRPGGAVVVAATYWDPVSIGTALLTKEVRIVPSAMYGHDHGDPRVRGRGRAARGAARSWSTCSVHHRFGLDDAARGVPRLGRPRRGRDQGGARTLTGRRP